MTRTLAASRKIFLRALEILAVVCLLLLASQSIPLGSTDAGSPADRNTSSRASNFIGNRRVQRDTLLARIFSRAGDPYNAGSGPPRFSGAVEHAIFRGHPPRSGRRSRPAERKDPRLLRDRSGPSSAASSTRETNRSPSRTFWTRSRTRRSGSPSKASSIPRKSSAPKWCSRSLLAAHGRQFATVKPTYERIAATNAVKLVFNIDEGPKVKVGTITIVGNKAFSSRRKSSARCATTGPMAFRSASPTFR